MGSCPLQFYPFQSCVEPPFWTELANRKLDQLKLSEEPLKLTGYYQLSNRPGLPTFLRVDHTSLGAPLGDDGSDGGQQQQPAGRGGAYPVPGVLHNYNTLEAFQAADRAAIVKQASDALQRDIDSGAAERDPSLLCGRVVLITYADLKKWLFYYWFAFPALKPAAAPFSCTGPPAPLDQALGSAQAAQAVARACTDWLRDQDTSGQPFWLVRLLLPPAASAVLPTGVAAGSNSEGGGGPETADAGHETAAAAAVAEVHPLSSWAALSADASSSSWSSTQGGGELLLATADPTSDPQHPGWPLRNALCLAARRWHPPAGQGLPAGRPGQQQQQGQQRRLLRVACLRGDGAGSVDMRRSTIQSIYLDPADPAPPAPASPPRPDAAAVDDVSGEASAAAAAAAPAALAEAPYPLGVVSGWEKNVKGKNGPRVVDMRPALDPTALAEQAVDLNLRLMRWRFAPGLDVGRLASLRCLLLGAGTLGCAVARGLLGWRASSITFVDNSRVSFSNPVRQALFTYEDCLEGGKPKAPAAAEALRSIYPNSQSQGIVMSIPMPGHPLSPGAEVEQAKRDVEQLDALVRSHDVVFLLTDTRESRWLPTLLAAARGKLAVTAALAFDEFVVLRHGGPPPEAGQAPEQQQQPSAAAAAAPSAAAAPAAVVAPAVAAAAAGGAGVSGTASGKGTEGGGGSQTPAAPPAPRLGCYFCNDVIAPTDSTRNRSLDQQCTVTRPGLSLAAGAVAAELCVNVVQHPMGVRAPHSDGSGGGGDGGGVGPTPHMVRGYLSSFKQTTFHGHAFGQCPACSGTVVEEYLSRGWGFVEQALQQPRYLEDVTGLTHLHATADEVDFDLEMTDDDEDDEGDCSSNRGTVGAAEPAEGGMVPFDGLEVDFGELRLIDELGRGTFYVVYSARWQEHTLVAVKRLLDQSEDMMQKFQQEVAVHRRLLHPNIVQLLGVCSKPPNMCIIFPLCSRGSLRQQLSEWQQQEPLKMPAERLRLNIARDVACGMHYLHSNKPALVHKDLKSDNVLLDKDWTAKVCDFSNVNTQDTLYFTAHWAAPEVLRGEPCVEKSNVYSYGVVLWELITLKTPWADQRYNMFQIFNLVGIKDDRLDIPDDVIPEVKTLLQDCWHREPTKRPAFGEVLERLKAVDCLTQAGRLPQA